MLLIIFFRLLIIFTTSSLVFQKTDLGFAERDFSPLFHYKKHDRCLQYFQIPVVFFCKSSALPPESVGEVGK